MGLRHFSAHGAELRAYLLKNPGVSGRLGKNGAARCPGAEGKSVGMNKTEEFLDLYKQLEEAAIERYGYPEDGRAVMNLERRPEFKRIKSELGYCREVRNLLQHKPKVAGSFAVLPSDSMLALLRQTVDKVANPPLAMDIAVPIASVFCKAMEDPVKPAMAEMQRRVFTHIPILDRGVVVGVFSENTVLACLLDGAVVLDENTRFSDLKAYLPMDRHRAETFRFVRQNTSAVQVGDLFERAVARQERVGLVFITRSGRSDEPLLGIISAWDIAGKLD